MRKSATCLAPGKLFTRVAWDPQEPCSWEHGFYGMSVRSAGGKGAEGAPILAGNQVDCI